jgi:histone H3/H4
VLDPLSEIVRRAIDDAIDSARREGRKTVLDRDVPAS